MIKIVCKVKCISSVSAGRKKAGNLDELLWIHGYAGSLGNLTDFWCFV